MRGIKTASATVLGLAGVIAVATAQAADYYVSPDGDDTNAGTLAAPWQHIAFATCGGSYRCPVTVDNPNKLKAGDTLYLRAGTYAENLIAFANSGAPTQPITVRSYPTETVVVDGSFDTSLVGQSMRAVFNIDGQSHIVLEGLEVRRGWRANIRLGENAATDSITIRNCVLRDLNAYDISGHVVLLNHASNAVIRGNTMYGRALPPQASTCSGSGVFVGYTGSYVIENNEMFDVGSGVHPKYKQVATPGAPVIRYNRIHGVACNGIHEVAADNAVIAHNVIYDVAGGGGIRIYNEAAGCTHVGGAGSVIEHNTVVGTGRGIGLWGPSACEGARDTVVQNNVVVNFTDGEHRGLSVWPYETTDASNTTFDHNLIYSAGVAQPVRVLGQYYDLASAPLAGTGNVQQAPVFVDAANGDYTLAAASPGKNAAGDGTDMGARICAVGPNPTCSGFGDTLAPAAPSNLAVQ